MGAVKVFETAPDTPPRVKSIAQAWNDTSSFGMLIIAREEKTGEGKYKKA